MSKKLKELFQKFLVALKEFLVNFLNELVRSLVRVFMPLAFVMGVPFWSVYRLMDLGFLKHGFKSYMAWLILVNLMIICAMIVFMFFWLLNFLILAKKVKNIEGIKNGDK